MQALHARAALCVLCWQRCTGLTFHHPLPHLDLRPLHVEVLGHTKTLQGSTPAVRRQGLTSSPPECIHPPPPNPASQLPSHMSLFPPRSAAGERTPGICTRTPPACLEHAPHAGAAGRHQGGLCFSTCVFTGVQVQAPSQRPCCWPTPSLPTFQRTDDTWEKKNGIAHTALTLSTRSVRLTP